MGSRQVNRYAGWVLALLAVAAATFAGLPEAMADRTAVTPDASLYPYRGVDLSAHNGDVDFGRIRNDGYDFVLLKVTEGTDFRDRRFVDNWRRAKEAGLRVGAYHFFRFDTDPQMQAMNLLHAVRYRDLDFPLVIDVEEWGNSEETATYDIIQRLRTLVEYVESAGQTVMIYTNKDGYRRFVKGWFDDRPLWLCSFSEVPDGTDWAIWQYSHRGHVDGVEGKVDLNAIKPEYFRLLR